MKQLCDLCKIKEEGFCCPDHCCDVSKLFMAYNQFLLVGQLQMRALQGKEKYSEKEKVWTGTNNQIDQCQGRGSPPDQV